LTHEPRIIQRRNLLYDEAIGVYGIVSSKDDSTNGSSNRQEREGCYDPTTRRTPSVPNTIVRTDGTVRSWSTTDDNDRRRIGL
jgi:hypothetical protein